MPEFACLRPEDIRNLDSFEFAPRLVVEGYLAGRHRSRDIGSSTEFRDFRPYVQGDDPTRVDWRVYGRTDRHYVRTFEMETNVNCTILLDSSASMGFGDKLTKLNYASFFAACIAYLVTRNQDQISLITFDESIRQVFPPGSTTRHLHDLLHALERNQPGSKTSLAETLRRAVALTPRRGTLILLSDFFDEPPVIFEALNPFVHRGFDIHLYHILDPYELKLPSRGLLRFDDLETGSRITAHSDELTGVWEKAMQQHVDALRALAVRRRMKYTVACTDRHVHNLFDGLVR